MNILDMNFSKWQVQRFLNRRIIERRNELRRLQMEANNRDTLETNRFLGLSIIEVIARNWGIQYDHRQIAFINDPENRFNDVKKDELAEDLITTLSWVYQYMADSWYELKSITNKHEEIICRKMVKKLFDPKEPGLTAQFLFQNKILKRF